MGRRASVMSRDRATIAQVASRARVSVGTVSNTLNHPERVLPSTRDRVWDTIRELGYVPSQAAQVLSGGPSRTLALVVPDIQSPFFTSLAHSVERTARDSGFSLLLCNSENDSRRELEILNQLSSIPIFGALVSPAANTGTVVSEPRVPVVYLDHPGSQGDCAVLVDHIAGGQIATDHLLSLGHRRIGFIYGHPQMRQFEQRLTGMRRALIAAGLNPSRSIIPVASEGIGVESGMSSASKLLEGNVPPAIFCGNDMLAFGVYKELTRRRVRVPEDVSLIGYDDILFAADWIKPLTTVAQPIDIMGSNAAALLIEHAFGRVDHKHRTMMLQPSLVVRESTASQVY